MLFVDYASKEILFVFGNDPKHPGASNGDFLFPIRDLPNGTYLIVLKNKGAEILHTEKFLRL